MNLNIYESDLQEIRRTMQSSWVAGSTGNLLEVFA